MQLRRQERWLLPQVRADQRVRHAARKLPDHRPVQRLPGQQGTGTARRAGGARSGGRAIQLALWNCERIRDTAVALRRALERRDWDEVGRQIATEWENRKRLASGVSTPTIDNLMALAKGAGATAAKVCGAGGGGCLFCYGPPAVRPAIADALVSGGARVLDYRIETEGLQLG